MKKLKYVLSFIFIMIVTAVTSYFVYMNSNDKPIDAFNANVSTTNKAPTPKDFDGAKKIAQSGFFGEFEKFLSDYDNINTPKDVIMPSIGDLVGTISIPSISLNSSLLYGDDEDELSRGVGIDPRQKVPGQNGNVILAGHNNMEFGSLGGLSLGDEVLLKTNYGTYVYKVDNYRVTQYDDKTVIVPKQSEFLTMYTCYPFDQYTPTPTRFVVTCTYAGKQ